MGVGLCWRAQSSGLTVWLATLTVPCARVNDMKTATA